MKLNVKKGDTVLMIAGKDKGKKGKITSCDPTTGRVVVEGCNIITKHSKPRGANQPGGINKMAGPVDVSNVQIICPSCNKATRVKAGEAEGKKVRACAKCGASLDAKAKTDKKKKSAKKEEETVTEKKPAKKTAKKVKDAEESVKEETTEEKPAKKKAAKAPAETESK